MVKMFITRPTKVNMNKKPEIKLNSCSSSNVAAHGHCDKTNTLAIQYKGSSKVYYYPDFSADKYKELGSAKSVGSFVSSAVKGRKFNVFDNK